MSDLTAIAPICFVDIETTGLDREVDEIWEFAGIRVDPDGQERTLHLFVEHDCRRAKLYLPEPYVSLHRDRCGGKTDGKVEATRTEAAAMITALFANQGGPRVHLASCTDFDPDMIRRFCWRVGIEPGWSYHQIDVESMALGYLRAQAKAVAADRIFVEPAPGGAIIGGRSPAGAVVASQQLWDATTPPWQSERLSLLLGVQLWPDRHTALADARWARAMYDAMTAG